MGYLLLVKFLRMSAICAAAIIIATGLTLSPQNIGHSRAHLSPFPSRSATPTAVWIPTTLWEDLIDLGDDVMKFLMRMVPGVG
jgi:hypothetical protein